MQMYLLIQYDRNGGGLLYISYHSCPIVSQENRLQDIRHYVSLNLSMPARAKTFVL
jgi:hypothetical protein